MRNDNLSPMTLINFVALILTLDELIRKGSTGSPDDLARRLHVTKRTVYYYIHQLKMLGAPISFDMFKRSYTYYEEFSLESILKKSPIVRKRISK